MYCVLYKPYIKKSKKSKKSKKVKKSQKNQKKKFFNCCLRLRAFFSSSAIDNTKHVKYAIGKN